MARPLTFVLLAPTVLALLVAVSQDPTSARQAPSTTPRHDTIFVAVQTPPPTVTVQSPAPVVNIAAPSQLTTVTLGVVGVILVVMQVWILGRQASLMNRQTELLAKQADISDQQWKARRDGAIAAFYRMAFDLARQLGNIGGSCDGPIRKAEPRGSAVQALRQANELFAPLGSALLGLVNRAGMILDDYFGLVAAHNEELRPREAPSIEEQEQRLDRFWKTQELRGEVGAILDQAQAEIPEELRRWWREGNGMPYSFRSRYRHDFIGESRHHDRQKLEALRLQQQSPRLASGAQEHEGQ